MKRLLGALGLIFGLVAVAGAQLERPGAFNSQSICRGLSCLWTRDTAIHLHQGPYEFFVRAPVDEDIGGDLVVTRNSKQVALAHLDELSASVSVTWAPDLRDFAVTWSDGGVIGGYHARLFRLDGYKFIEVPSLQKALDHFRQQHDCKTRGDNEQAYRFEAHGRELMLILSVYNTSDCGLEMGHTEGYLVRTSDGTILRCYNNQELNVYLRRHPEGS